MGRLDLNEPDSQNVVVTREYLDGLFATIRVLKEEIERYRGLLHDLGIHDVTA